MRGMKTALVVVVSVAAATIVAHAQTQAFVPRNASGFFGNPADQANPLVLAEQAAAQAVVGVQGDYLEVRSSEVYTCGCLYSSEMVTAGKEAILIWRISSGNYQGIPLTGIKVAAVVVGENNLGVDGTLRQTALYVDGITQEAQQRTILELWRREYSLILGEIKSVHTAPVNFEQRGERVSVRIPGIALVTVRKARLPGDAHLGSVLWYQPFVPLRSSSLVTTLHYEYSGGDFLRNWSELLPSISGYTGNFTLPAAS